MFLLWVKDGGAPSEFWKMHPVEWWWWYESKLPAEYDAYYELSNMLDEEG